MMGTLVGTGLAVASSLIGGAASRSAMKKAEQEARNQKARNDAWYNRRYNEDYLDTGAGRNVVRKALEFANANTKRAQGAAVVGGATDVAAAQAKEAGNKVVGDTMANVAAQDTARKTEADRVKMNNDNNYSHQQMAIQEQKAANSAQVAGAVSNALMQAGSAFDEAGGSSVKKTAETSTGDTTVAQSTNDAYEQAKETFKKDYKLKI